MFALFDLTKWFSIQPPELSLRAAGFFAIAAGILMVVGIALIVLGAGRARRDPHAARGARRLGAWFLTWGLLGLFWIFFVYQRVNLLGAPFWFLFGVLGAIAWLIFIIHYWTRTLPKIRAASRVRTERERYLPKRSTK